MYVHILIQSFQTLTIYKEVFFSSASYDFIFWFSIFIHKSIMLKFCLSHQNFCLIIKCTIVCAIFARWVFVPLEESSFYCFARKNFIWFEF